MKYARSTPIRLAAIAAFIVLIAAACASSGAPNSLSDQVGPVSEELAAALPGIDAGAELPLVQRNFLEGCALGDEARVDGVTGDALGNACICAYDGIFQFYLDAAEAVDETARQAEALKGFDDLDDELSKSSGVVPANIQTILDGCRS